MGKWDEVVRITEELPPGLETQALGLHVNTAEVARHRGDIGTAREALEKVAALENSASFQDRAVYVATKFNVLMAEGRHEEALALVDTAKADLEADIEAVWVDLVIADAALASGRVDRAAEAVAVVEALSPGDTGPLIRAQASRFRALIAAAEGDAQRAEDSFKIAAAAFREYGTPFLLACTQLEQAEWLVTQSRADEVELLLAEAREVFERLRATPWLERADALAARLPAVAVR
jgi:ATP/maltotriose-dependent transcriptional regulator MalT